MAWLGSRIIATGFLVPGRIPVLGLCNSVARSISLTPVHFVKKIEETVVGDTTVIEGVYVDHLSDNRVVKVSCGVAEV